MSLAPLASSLAAASCAGAGVAAGRARVLDHGRGVARGRWRQDAMAGMTERPALFRPARVPGEACVFASR